MQEYSPIRAKRSNGPVVKINRVVTQQNGEIEYLTFPALERTGIAEHLFTTRQGGVSQGIYSSMNLSFTRGDDAGHVTENYRRITRLLGCGLQDIVCTDQTHTTNIRRVTGKDGGKGVLYPKDYQDVDGLVTDEPGLVLAAFYADCVPLYFVDTKHGAVGLAHSGWRGTVHKMGACMCRRMEREFGTSPKDLTAAIGPSICRSCYEVSEDVAQEFQKAFSGTEGILQEILQSEGYEGASDRIVSPGRAEGKYQLDLWLANLVILRQAGIPLQNISVTDICTCHNPDYLFSHRASHGRRGNMGAFLMLKKN